MISTLALRKFFFYAGAVQPDMERYLVLLRHGCLLGLELFFSFEDWSHLAYLELMDTEGMEGERAADNFRVGYANYDGSGRRVYSSSRRSVVSSQTTALKVSGYLRGLFPTLNRHNLGMLGYYGRTTRL